MLGILPLGITYSSSEALLKLYNDFFYAENAKLKVYKGGI